MTVFTGQLVRSCNNVVVQAIRNLEKLAGIRLRAPRGGRDGANAGILPARSPDFPQLAQRDCLVPDAEIRSSQIFDQCDRMSLRIGEPDTYASWNVVEPCTFAGLQPSLAREQLERTIVAKAH